MPHHVTVVADGGPYLPWAAGLVRHLPAGTRGEIVLAGARPGRRRAGPTGADAGSRAMETSSPTVLARRVDRSRIDAVLLACPAGTARAYLTELARTYRRPVLIAGFPGIALPAPVRARAYGSLVDLFIVHSRRELRAHRAAAQREARAARIALASLPALLRPPVDNQQPARRTVVFVAQSGTPSSRDERVAVLMSLARLAASRRDLQVLVASPDHPAPGRARYEHFHYPNLWRGLVTARRVDRGSRVRFVQCPPADLLPTASALVSVSSVTLLEAMASGVPVLVLDPGGAAGRTTREVFGGSGCLGEAADLEAADFRHPDPRWAADNYFHPVAENTWTEDLLQLCEQAEHNRTPLVTGLAPHLSPGRRRRSASEAGSQKTTWSAGSP